MKQILTVNLWSTSTCLFPSFFCSLVQHERVLIPAQHVKEGYWIYVKNHKQIVQLVKQWGMGGWGKDMWPDAEVTDGGSDNPLGGSR